MNSRLQDVGHFQNAAGEAIWLLDSGIGKTKNSPAARRGNKPLI
jgi:hypothetical protein